MSETIRCPVAHQTMWKALSDKDYRHAFAEGHVSDFLASQIYTLRIAREWNQGELASRAGVTQPMICGWEKGEGARLSSLFKLAEAFDVALIVKFAPFSQLAKEAISIRADQDIPSYDDESPMAIGYPNVRFSKPEPRNRAPRNGGPVALGYLREDAGFASAHSQASVFRSVG